MALKTGKLSEVPKGELVITKREAVQFQLDIMETLCPATKRVFLRYGFVISSLTGAVTCIYLQNYYRTALNVQLKGRMASSFPAFILPAVLNMTLHKLLITENILVQKWACPVCYQLRSGLLNLSCGSLYPAIVAPIIAAKFARDMKFDVPPVNSKRGIQFLLEKMKPIGRYMGLSACFQFIIGVAVAEMEARENNDFNKNINNYIEKYHERLRKANAES